MQSTDRPPLVGASNVGEFITPEALIEAYLSRIAVEHRAKVRERLLRTDKVVFAQSSDPEGQAILDRFYRLRRPTC
jgi:hypothetical protein